MRGFVQEIVSALKRLRRSPGFTAFAVIVLGLGLGTTLYMFAIVRAYTLSPLPYPGADRIMYLSHSDPRRGIDFIGVPVDEYVEWEKAQTSFTALAMYYTNSVIVADAENAERVSGVFVTPSVFDVVRTEAYIGRTLLPSDALPGAPWVIVLGYDIWRNRYNSDPAILGKTIHATGVPATIVGVMPPGFRFPTTQQAWIPLKLDLADFGGGKDRYLDAVGRLRPDVSLARAKAEFANLSAATASNNPESRDLQIEIDPFQHAYVGPDTRSAIWAMFGAVLFVLLLACANVANLILARTTARQKDVVLRAALGASRTRIVTHILAESLILSAGGALIGYLIANLGLEVTRNAYAAADIEEPFWVVLQIDYWALIVAAAAAVAVGVIAGLASAVRASRANVNEYLKEGATGSGEPSSRLSHVLVSAEIAVSCALLVCAGLMIRTVIHLESRPLGIDNSNLLTGSIDLPLNRYQDPKDWYAFYEELTTRLNADPDVVDATVASSYPGMNSWISTYRSRDTRVSPGEAFPLAQFAGVMDNYADMLGVQIRSGRWFDASDRADGEPVAIVDARFAAQVFPGVDPVGRQIAVAQGRSTEPSEWRTIVGVTEPTFMGRLDAVDRPAIFVPLRQNPYVFLKAAVRTRGQPLAFANKLRDIVHGMDSDLAVFWIRSHDNWLIAGNFESRSISAVFGVFSVVALLLCAAGIYGVLAYAVSRRTREIGLRRALGALDYRIINMILGQTLKQVVAGVVIGIASAVMFVRFLSGYLYGVTSLDPATLAGAALILTAVALIASLVPVLRATRVDPTQALRSE